MIDYPLMEYMQMPRRHRRLRWTEIVRRRTLRRYFALLLKRQRQ